MERYIGIDNKGLWPNLTRLADQTLGVLIFNQPCHGTRAGEVEAWHSVDGGRTWQRRGVPVPHGEGEIRLNVAAGLTADGAWLCAVWAFSGWSPELEASLKAGRITWGEFWTTLRPIPAKVSRSRDGGFSWEIVGELPSAPGFAPIVPYGDIHAGEDGCLRMSAYADPAQTDSSDYLEIAKLGSTFFLRSPDGGVSWDIQSTLPIQGSNETAPIYLGGGHWLAAARVLKSCGQHLSLCESHDDGATWTEGEILGIQGSFPGAFLQMKDRLLLIHGSRYLNHNGIFTRVFDQENRGWTTQRRIVDLTGSSDVGYPSAVLNSEGRIVVAYYADGTPFHNRYHMGVLILEDAEL